MDSGLPFDRYPGGGRVPIERARGDLARRGYARNILEWCAFRCAYCGLDMSRFEGWLLLSVDHVVPQNTTVFNGYPREWVQNPANTVAACRTCNDLFNRDRVTDPVPPSLGEFFDLRDRLFRTRRDRIHAKLVDERAWFDANVVLSDADK